MRKDTTKELTKIQRLVGEISEDNLRHVDYYVSEHFSIFIPSVGFCEYAIRPQHTHPAYSFILFFSKEQRIIPVNIELPTEHYLVTAISPGVPHEEEKTDFFTRYIAILISKELFEKLYTNYSSTAPEQYIWEQFVIEHEIMIYIKKFMSEYENSIAGYENMLEAIAIMITHQLIRRLLKIDNKVDFITDKFEIEKSIECIHQCFGKKLTVAELSKLANMSESHFIRIFKKETGMAPMEFLIKTRIDKAKKLLRSRTKNITEVSLQCGFSSTSHFSSSFAKHTGVSPSEYQNDYNEQQNKQDYYNN
ncbi:MAG: helix-turn-helix transcriptional regulator [Desulfitobacteriaceae bacterium]